MKNVITTVGALAVLTTGTMSSAWEVSVDKDVMTGEKNCYVIGKWIKPLEKMAFPYQGIRQAISVGVTKDSAYVYFANSLQPNLTDDELQDGYSEATRRVKFDNNVEEYRQTQDFGSAFIHIGNNYSEYDSTTSQFNNIDKNDLEFIKKLKTNKSVIAEFGWYNNGDVHFKHDLTGFGKAYEQAKSKCGNTMAE